MYICELNDKKCGAKPNGYPNEEFVTVLTQKSLPFWPALQRYAFECCLILQGLLFPRNPKELCKQQQPSACEHLWKARIKQGNQTYACY